MFLHVGGVALPMHGHVDAQVRLLPQPERARNSASERMDGSTGFVPVMQCSFWDDTSGQFFFTLG